MKIVIDSTDKKHIGEQVDDDQDLIVFANGEVMPVEFRRHNDTVLGNSNYIIVLSQE